MVRVLPVMVLLLLGLPGCWSATPDDMVGTWVVTDRSRELFLAPSQRNAAARIRLDADRTFVASEVPEDLLYVPPGAADGLVSGSGVWSLVGRGRELRLRFDRIAIGQRGGVPYGASLDVSAGKQARIELFYFRGGDADQGRRVEFGKR